MKNRNIILNGGACSASARAEITRRATKLQLGFAIQKQPQGQNPDAGEAARLFGYYCVLAARHNDWVVLYDAVLKKLRRQGRTDTINQNIVKDIAGPSREGVTAQTYQHLKASGGLNDVLTERLSILLRLPDFAAGVMRQTPRLLPIKLRSR